MPLLLGLLLLTLAGCHRADGRASSLPQAEFKRLFGQHCSGCHGNNGRQGPAPPLNDALFLTIVTDPELEHVIVEGRPGTMMTAFARERGGQLEAAEIKALVKGIRFWGKEYDAETADKLLRAPAPGAADNGMKVFSRACASCHGEQGQGMAKGAGAVNQSAFLALTSQDALRLLIISGRPDLPRSRPDLYMPNFHEKTGRGADYTPLTGQDIADLLALFAQWKEGN